VAGARTLVGVAALIFLLAHLLSLPVSLEDLDSINFAMGVRDFDVAKHQPHPPGYPVFTALAKVATAAGRAAGVQAPEVRGLAVWSVVGGALTIPFAFVFFRSIGGHDRHAVMASLLLGASPIFWFTSLRPLSDVAGLAAAFGALAALSASIAPKRQEWSRRRIGLALLGGFAAGLAVGVRSQTAVLAGPMLAYVLVAPRDRMPLRIRGLTLAAAALGAAAWAVPLVAATGGPASYLASLGAQAGEDFSGVEMLWTNGTPRAALFALQRTFVLPWDSALLAGVVLALAAAGFVLLLTEATSAAGFLVLVFGPYAVFHLLFQETVTIRYALPLVPPVAFMAATLPARAVGVAGPAVALAVGGASLIGAVPASAAFARNPAPVFGMLDEMKLIEARGAAPFLAVHFSLRRACDWVVDVPGTLLPSRRDFEWLELTRAWREEPDREGWFAADSRRADLALIDAEYRRTRKYRWPFDARVYVGGARPMNVDWHVYTQPGWFLERGWALTPEIAGITEREGWGPHQQPSVGWIRRRPGPSLLMFGGRHLGGPDDPPARLIVTLDDAEVTTLDVTPGYFLQFVPFAAGRVAGEGYARLTVRAQAVDGGAAPRVAIEQFNFQSADVLQFGLGEGWYEPELEPESVGGRGWRWMSDAARILVRPTNRGVTVRAAGVYPADYYREPLRLWLTAGDRTIAEFRAAAEFEFEAVVPAEALQAAQGMLILRASETFVPGEREGTADRRRLAARIYNLEVRPFGP
jgi:hypothetical protein